MRTPVWQSALICVAVLCTCVALVLVWKLHSDVAVLKKATDDMDAPGERLEREAAEADAEMLAKAADAESLKQYGLRPGQIVLYGEDTYEVIRATGVGSAARIIGARVTDGKVFGLWPPLCTLPNGG